VYFGGARLPPLLQYANSGFDDSQLQATWDAIRQMTQIDQSAASLAMDWQINVQKIDGLSALSTGDQAAAFQTRMRAAAMYRGLLGTEIMDAKDSYELKQTKVSGWKELQGGGRDALSAAERLPQTLVFGKAPEGLNTDGESQRAHTANVIKGVQLHRMNQPLRKVYNVLYHARKNRGEGAIPKSWHVYFPPYDELTESQQADLLLKAMQAAAVGIQEGIFTPAWVAKSFFSKNGFTPSILPIPDPEALSREALAQGALIAGKPAPVPSQRPATPSPKAPFARGRSAGDRADRDDLIRELLALLQEDDEAEAAK
jgi:phage-related protein (TIGR01555 family)